ncbi:histidine phosphatase family protein [Neotabrizicola sp. sgz301269]|uniref:histidine phosphatase family protein n=1 Tax=Neotabrizicola sp. sgz301269 TaxID=3276282 RepID=UPI00376FEF0D
MSDCVHCPHVLYLLRHGETEWNREGRIQGSLNSPLTDRGLSQARQQAAILKRALQHAGRLSYYSSPLPRARQTAAIALDGTLPILEPRLRELDCGAWEALSPEERALRDPELVRACVTDFDLYRSAPGGEGLEALEQRLRAFLEDVRGPSVIVAHKVVLIILRGLLTNLPRERWESIEASQGTVIRVSDGQEEIFTGSVEAFSADMAR